MENKEILYQAIKNAEKNGYKYTWERHVYSHRNWTYDISVLDNEHPEIIIFSHEFAKAFWGESGMPWTGIGYLPKWKHHLQQMVLEKEPLKYLEKFL